MAAMLESTKELKMEHSMAAMLELMLAPTMVSMMAWRRDECLVDMKVIVLDMTRDLLKELQTVYLREIYSGILKA